jgi:hypothetical protein
MSEVIRLRGDDLDWREVEGEVVVLDVRRSVYVAVNASGAVLWPALADGATREALVDRLVTRYDKDPQDAGVDVDAFVADLRAQGLLAS